ncbi:MAG: hypothetical protein ABMA25_05700 [Ilumatobacteraceae bacterium]
MTFLRAPRRGSFRSLLAGSAAVAALLLGTACSDDSSTASTSAAPPVTAPADSATGSSVSTGGDTGGDPGGDPGLAPVVEGLLADAAEFGVSLDAACVEAQLGQLSEADLALLTDWANDDDPEATIPSLSDEGEAVGEGLNACVAPSDTSDGAVTEAADAEVVEQAVALVVAEEGDSADQDCLRANLRRLSNEQLQILLDEGSGSDNPALDPVFVAVLTCLE